MKCSVSSGRLVTEKEETLFFWNLASGLIAERGSAGSAGALKALHGSGTWALCASSLVFGYNVLYVPACASNVFCLTFWTSIGLGYLFSFFFFFPKVAFPGLT